MCSLQEHIEREIRAREASKTEAAHEAVFSCPDKDDE